VLLDVKMPRLSGLETLKHVRQLASAAIVIMMTAYGTVRDAVELTKLRAYDFMIKSVDLKGLDAMIERALEVLLLRQRLESELGSKENRHNMKALADHSPAMQQLEQVREVTKNPKFSMMLLAETGSRDEFLAQVIHHNGSLEVGPFIGLNFTTIPKESFESQWFGFERGASTGTN
jgi:two-component system response regulator AtoC